MEKPYVVGMDIGGTNTVFGIVDSRGNVLATDSVKTQSFSKIEDYVEAVSSKLRPLIESFGGVEKIKGMGVGAPNGNYYNGTIEFAPNLPWKGVIPLATLFEEAIGVPTALTNDANAAAIGEMTYGAARGMKDFIMITLGTGVGSGIVINGQLVYGHDGFAGELGHVIVDTTPEARLCGCGRKGCLEAYCSATGVARTNPATPPGMAAVATAVTSSSTLAPTSASGLMSAASVRALRPPCSGLSSVMR